MRLVYVLVAALFVSPAGYAGDTFAFDYNGWQQVIMPPDHWFDRPLIAPVSIFPVDAETTVSDCGFLGVKFETLACASVIDGYYCRITINQELPANAYAAVLRHEMAHCHGWSANHPTDVPTQPIPQVIDYLLEQYSGG